jgi:hypothetical protein
MACQMPRRADLEATEDVDPDSLESLCERLRIIRERLAWTANRERLEVWLEVGFRPDKVALIDQLESVVDEMDADFLGR